MEHEYISITDDNEKILWVNEYRIVWVNSDYEIQETFRS